MEQSSSTDASITRWRVCIKSTEGPKAADSLRQSGCIEVITIIARYNLVQPQPILRRQNSMEKDKRTSLGTTEVRSAILSMERGRCGQDLTRAA
jgi:hypothetical protein